MTIITFPVDDVRPAHPHLRRFDARTDLGRVADLVERCFDETLDADGRRYIQNMRRAATGPQLLRWAAGANDRSSGSFNGFVWEQEGAIIGNLSLIPMPGHGERVFLIANVAVEPGHRRRGIARSLTEAALEETHRRRADRLWLHVRDDNAAAIRLYDRVGFREHTRRTTWYNTRRLVDPPGPIGPDIIALPLRHWALTQSWLRQLHPPDLDWYLSLNVRALQPGPAGWFHRLLTGAAYRVWAAVRSGRLLGVLAWQDTPAAADRLWLAAPAEPEPAVLAALARRADRSRPGHKPLNLEYPAGLATGALGYAGFTPHHTLIWMQREGA
ncbi:MAG TPA: GNAT family N-acetyltransferase [Anaerolineales bacterium]|nr:GNAT family N-acetyltransferase [Anaerolineales bacterium]